MSAERAEPEDAAFKAFVLVRNLETQAAHLDFGDFHIRRVAEQFREVKLLFPSIDVNPDDWILEKVYSWRDRPIDVVPEIKTDVEAILVLLRLYKPGEIVFARLTILFPHGGLQEIRSRAINDSTGSSLFRFAISPEEQRSWTVFSHELRGTESWHSDWFSASKRLFLNGGAKRFIPNEQAEQVDRVFDYVAALNASLVPEFDFNKRRMCQRAAQLIAGDGETDRLVQFFNRIYAIRSEIAHGSNVGADSRMWLASNAEQMEIRVRRVHCEAVRVLPAEKAARLQALAELYDPTDKDRQDYVIQKFKEIKSAEVQSMTADEIGKLVRK